MSDMKALLLQAFDKHHVNAELRAGIAALCGGESEFKPAAEVSYAHTSVARIREIFPTRTHGLTDAYIESVKTNDQAFFEFAYGNNPELGNNQPGDGYKYRGRGIIQLTGRGNYGRYGQMVDVDLLADPDRENEPEVAVETAVVYMLDRYKGGGWDKMKQAVGNSFGNVDTRKNELFAAYIKSGEWNASPPAATPVSPQPAEPQPQDTVAGAGQVVPQPGTVAAAGTAGAGPAVVENGDPPNSGAVAVHMEPIEGLRRIQRIMIACGFYVDAKGAPHNVDGDFRGQSISAIDGLVRAAGQPGVIGQKGE